MAIAMDGTIRASILLLGVGEASASEILKYLEPKQVQKIGQTMSKLANVSLKELETVVDEFLSIAENQTHLCVDSEKYVREVFIKALGEEKATLLFERILSDNQPTGLSQLKWLEPIAVADLIRHEHPQTIAAILSYLDSEQSAAVLACLPETKRLDIILRMAGIQSVKPEALNELGKVVETQLSLLKSGSQMASLGGVKTVANLINHLNPNLEGTLLEGLEAVDHHLAEQVKENMFVFENLMEVDNQSLQKLLREVSSDRLLIALKGTDQFLKDKLFANMSKKAAELLKDDLDVHGPVKISDVEMAQKDILSLARRLAESGEIVLGSRGRETMV